MLVTEACGERCPARYRLVKCRLTTARWYIEFLHDRREHSLFLPITRRASLFSWRRNLLFEERFLGENIKSAIEANFASEFGSNVLARINRESVFCIQECHPISRHSGAAVAVLVNIGGWRDTARAVPAPAAH